MAHAVITGTEAPGKVEFGILREGDWFVHDDTLFCKVYRINIVGSAHRNAFNAHAFVYATFIDGSEVRPVESITINYTL